MTGEDLKEQLLSTLRTIGEKIQDTPTYGRLKDSFDGLSPSMQRVTMLGGILLAFLVVLMIPWAWYSESQEIVDVFEERRSVIRELLKVSREAADVPPIPMAPPVESLRAEVEARLKDGSLLEEQVKSIEASDAGSKLIPADKSHGSLAVSLGKLNVRQIVDIGSMLSRLNPSVKVTDVAITANREDTRYFDVIYRLTALAVPDLSAPPPEPETPRGAGRRGSRK